MAEKINVLKIQKNGAATEVKIYDGDGVAHDITSKFRGITGSTTPAAVTNCFQGQADGTAVKVDFQALGKEMEFTLTAIAAKQICALADD